MGHARLGHFTLLPGTDSFEHSKVRTSLVNSERQQQKLSSRPHPQAFGLRAWSFHRWGGAKTARWWKHRAAPKALGCLGQKRGVDQFSPRQV